jgi:hypothetical protein
MYEQEARAARELTADMVGRLGARLTGSPACLAAATELRDLAGSAADATALEAFTVHPGAFLGFIKVMIVLYVGAFLALPFAPWASFAALALGAAVLVLEFFLYHETIDPFFPRREGRNVTAVLEPRGEAKRQVVVSGHHDSAFVFNFYVDHPELYGFRLYGGMGSFAAFLVAAGALAAIGPSRAVLVGASVLFAALFAFVLPLWRFASKEGTPGAGDNLAASAVALGLLGLFRKRRDAGKGLESTRLIFVSFDAEEAGLRGARAWAKAHAKDFAALPTWNYNMDCLYKAGDARFLTSDINGSVRLDAAAAEACAEAARKRGVTAPVEPIAFLTGGTDAAELAKRGARATTLIGMQWSNEARGASYHTMGDTVEAVSPEVVELAFGVGVEFIERLDAGELD